MLAENLGSSGKTSRPYLKYAILETYLENFARQILENVL